MTVAKGLHDEVRHGYTMADVHRLAKGAANGSRGMAADYSDLYETAWHAIVEALLITSHWPSSHDLAIAGRNAIRATVYSDRLAYGYRNRDAYAGAGSAPRFARYWGQGTPATFADGIVESIAVRQISDALEPRDRRILEALAAAGDYALAAELLDLNPSTFRYQVVGARRRWLDLWLDGETPHRLGRNVWKGRNVELLPCGTHAAWVRHDKRGDPIDVACAEAREQYNAEQRDKLRARRVALRAAADDVLVGGDLL